ncbi:DMT family transporter [Seohaeicola zhoushanensis]|uniref:Membrane protein n=1 Tax=Seohaeicola zhoushanensis TaxID=1569283 RepID=A0A8J3GXY6_9RHOB|nr:DMT family transporter [Seohaeicola zhoushanensis]GHF50642.1 membrane protein [Seohaeicola zhoushanensis]
MSLWIPVTLAAAVFQTLRFMLQKLLSGSRLSVGGATFARFAYSAPLVIGGLLAWSAISGRPIPQVGAHFWIYAAIGGLTQILATVCVVMLFKQRNFAVGITFKKTEVIQTALVGFLILGEGISTAALGAIVIGLVGVLLLSRSPDSQDGWWRQLTGRAPLIGLASGVLFAFSAVTYRGASLEVEAEPVLRAAVTLAAVVGMQFIAMGLWLAWREKGQITAVWRARRTAAWVGLTSLGGSFCWFLAFTLQNAAYVNALGQVEMVLSLLASVLFFREKITGREIGGMALLGLSILILVLVI